MIHKSQYLVGACVGLYALVIVHSPQSKSRFRVVANTQAEEDAFDVVGMRHLQKPCGVVASIAHLVKGALGAGILSGHVAYMKAGVGLAVPFTALLGSYLTYCLYILVINAQILYRRTGIPSMTYPDVGEAAVACFPNPKISKFSKVFRYVIDIIICIDLFGSCATYQIIIAKTLKQVVEDTHVTSIHSTIPGYPGLRVYLAAMIIPCILICLLRHLQWLAPFSIVANMFVVLCICVTISYAFANNSSFENLELYHNMEGFFEFTGMMVFSMSCAGVVIPVENNMKEPHKYPIVLFCGMAIVVFASFCSAFFGYVAYLDKCDSPITVNYPMEILPKILKICIAVMIYVTHALNYWVPFQLCFHYIEKLHKNKTHIIRWELFYRALFVVIISLIAITFPSINALMGFLGCFCLSNMAFIWPNTIELLVKWHRPGLGKFNWRLWKSIVLIFIGIILLTIGTWISVNELAATFKTETPTMEVIFN